MCPHVCPLMVYFDVCVQALFTESALPYIVTILFVLFSILRFFYTFSKVFQLELNSYLYCYYYIRQNYSHYIIFIHISIPPTPGAYEHRKVARRSIKLQYVLQTICCRITPLQTALYGKPL